MIDAFNRRDLDAFGELATPDVVVSSSFLDAGGDFRARAGAERYLAMLDESWGSYRLVIGEFRDLGDAVLLLGHAEARGTGSGVQVRSSYGGIVDFRGGKISRIRGFLDQGEALRAAGL